uniref:Fibulin-1 n=1 Tax=Panagrellus redivivus TaxID=6233 RepID=A0A7E4UMX8_PANRE
MRRLLIVLIAFVPAVLGIAELARCCAGGARHYRETNTCLNLKSIGSSVTCSRTASICCLRALLDTSCKQGVTLAEGNGYCSMNVNGQGGGIERECCDCCLLAKDLVANKKPCVAPPGFSSVCLLSFNQCCSSNSNATAIPEVKLITDGPPQTYYETGNKVGTYKAGRCVNNPCDHECNDRGGEDVECSCHDGYDLGSDGKSCIDIDECLTLAYDCLESQRCLNTPGSYKCIRTLTCGTGYALDSETEECLDVDECNMGAHDCGPLYQCRNTQGSFRCDPKRCSESELMNPQTGECQSIDCPLGYKAKDGKCEDIDECATPNRCSIYEDCINSPGSYRCQEKGNLCYSGYKMNVTTGFCIDIDECADPSMNNCPPLRCFNTPGSYRCICSPGYEFNATTHACEDVDECVKFAGHMCNMHATCINMPGTFKCHCKPGYQLSEDGRNCEDIDECASGIAKCQQTCVNTPGSFQCICDRGYQLSSDERTCDDINECDRFSKAGNSICMGECVNTPGSFKCTCPLGYAIQNDSVTCRDIDECATLGCYDPKSICVNTLGSYKCQRINCPPNYIPDRHYKNRCVRSPNLCKTVSVDICKQYPAHMSWEHIAIPKHVNISSQRTSVTLFSMKGPSSENSLMQFELRVVKAKPDKANVIPAIRSNFLIQKGETLNSAQIALRDTLDGPQEVHLELVLRLHVNGELTSKYIANLIIYVSQYRPPPLTHNHYHHKHRHHLLV